MDAVLFHVFGVVLHSLHFWRKIKSRWLNREVYMAINSKGLTQRLVAGGLHGEHLQSLGLGQMVVHLGHVSLGLHQDGEHAQPDADGRCEK